ncbi:hypothetical protein [Phreatobacter sp.]|uniref:hypothetical protein n=1 Tax=Phreatobacter sp. TaxID=1966341 RepID=UPI0022C51011|nr:hypothetical protein [Phreatobacter sp.]MCZ8313586.1 hypothetical protein [Phreatobacter sp.]
MDILLHGLVWLALVAAFGWVLSFWPRWVADDLAMPQRLVLTQPWRPGLAPYLARWPFISLAFYAHLWRRGRILECAIAVIVLVSALRAASAFFKTAGAVVRAAA